MDIARTAAQTALAQRAGEASAHSSPFHRRNLALVVVLFFVALLTLMTLQVITGINPFSVSPVPYYVTQAQSFLHGRWDLMTSQNLHDTIRLNGAVYMVYPPFPALVMLPFVALFGAHTSDIFITAVISALNLPLLYLLFEQARVNGLSRRSPRENLIISLLLYFGSINLYLSLGGEVWFTAQVICFACTLASLLLALRRHFAWSAALLCCGFFTRATIALAIPLLLYLAWQNGGAETRLERFIVSLWRRKPDWREIPWARLIPPVVVCLVAIALLALRNALMFGGPFETGFGIQLQQDYPQITHGLYSIAYVPRNLLTIFFGFPFVTYTSPSDLAPTVTLVGQGMGVSVLVTTPVFLFLYAKNQRVSSLRVALHITILVFVIETLLYSWTGWYQFGARYLFDAYPFAFLLLALNERRIDWRFVALGVFGLVINALGARQFWS